MNLSSNGSLALTVVKGLAVLVLAGARCSGSWNADARPDVARRGTTQDADQVHDASAQARDAAGLVAAESAFTGLP